MLRVALRLAYDGTACESYARTPGRRTVEGALLEALAHEGYVEGSFRTGSRTDAGVSALENVCAVSLQRPHLRGLVPALQSRLPDGVWVTAAAHPAEGFDPRKATWRQYRYVAPARGEDAAALAQACLAFAGRHHMGAFARLEAGRDPVRSVESFTVQAEGGLWAFTVRGQSFLWGQVRRMVGAALAVGQRHALPNDIAAALASGVPHPRFTAAPAAGLLLERVHYEGLSWDGEAGRVQAEAAADALVQAEVRRHVARHLQGLAQEPAAPR